MRNEGRIFLEQKKRRINMMDYSNSAKQIVDLLGGDQNIKSLAHCMTRLRFGLEDNSKIDDEKVKAVPGVLGVVRAGAQYQVIIGNEVTACYEEVKKLISLGNDTEKHDKKKEKLSLKGIGSAVLDYISGSIAPAIPVILGCGMVKILLIVLDLIGVSSTLPTYQILTMIGDTGYYFLPIILAYTASKKLGCHTTLSIATVSILLHPSLIEMLGKHSTTFLKIPVTAATYSSTVIPALLTVWVISIIEPVMDKIFKSWTKTLLKPMAMLLICVPIELIVLAPLGTLLGQGMAYVLNSAYSVAPWLTIGVYSALLPLVVMCGMHVAVFPYIFSNLDTLGFDYLQLPAMLAYNLGQAAACLAVAVKTKNKDMKATATAAAISAGVGGITEPALYGVSLRLRKPLIASMIASGITGVFIGAVGLKAFAFSGPCLLSFPMFASSKYVKNFVMACIAAVLSVVITFVLTMLMGWEDPEEETAALTENKDTLNTEDIKINAPVKGEAIKLEEVKDETFASGMLGQGMAIKPEEGAVYAPCNGTISALFPTLHAIGLTDETGRADILIHIGMNTVELDGKGFEAFCKMGDQVKKGDLLIRFDLEGIKAKGYDVTTPVIISNTNDFGQIITKKQGKVTLQDEVLELSNQMEGAEQ